MVNNQKQKSGDNSQQLQAGLIIVNNGITEKRAREIYDEKFQLLRKEFSGEAFEKIQNRISNFENDLITRMQRIEGALNAFADPSFQSMLTTAHKTAAITDSNDDYAILSELLIHKIKKGNNKNETVGIRQAIEIVNEIPEKALLGLTVEYAWSMVRPVSGKITQGLDVLDNLFSEFTSEELPIGDEWLEQLDILNAIRITDFSTFKKVDDYYYEVLSGYSAVGIEKDSENYHKALGILRKENLQNLLIPHELNDGYYRLEFVNENQLEKYERLKIDTTGKGIYKLKLNEKEKKVLKEVFSMYNNSAELKDKIKENLKQEILRRNNLSKLKNWIESIPKSFTTTPIGKVLAHANAQRINSEFPPLN